MNSTPRNRLIKTQIEYDGQPYVDEPVFAEPAKRLTTPLAEALAEIAGRVKYIQHGGSVIRVRTDLPPRILLAYQHIKLTWVKPDETGNLIPR